MLTIGDTNMRTIVKSTATTATTTNNKGTMMGQSQQNEEINHIECVDRILEMPGDPNQAGALFNLLLKIGQSPNVRRDAMNHITNYHMMKMYEIH